MSMHLVRDYLQVTHFSGIEEEVGGANRIAAQERWSWWSTVFILHRKSLQLIATGTHLLYFSQK